MNDLWNPYDEEAAKQMLQLSFIGCPQTIKTQMKNFVEKTRMNEIMIISNIFNQKAKLHSYKLFADLMKEIGS
jgi:hypothetical protein